MDLTKEIGAALRRARRGHGMTLRAAAHASRGRFKPSSIAGYERGERAITLQRFCDLAELYGADATRLLDGILREARAALVAVSPLEGNPADPGSSEAPVGGVLDLRDEEEPELSTSRPRSS